MMVSVEKDILFMVQINKPALLKQLFHLACHHSSQILSYQKMLGQLHDVGNTTTLSHYLTLLTGGGLITGIEKYAGNIIRQRRSSPKLVVLNTALMSAQNNLSFIEAMNQPSYWGRLVEICIGAHLLNIIKGTTIKIFYWREHNLEVDFVLKQGDKITAIEVKSGQGDYRLHGLETFIDKFEPSKVLIIGEQQGLPVKNFLSQTAVDWI